MSIRYTYVIEYQDERDAPLIAANMTALGGQVVAVNFSDALEELDVTLSYVTPSIREFVQRDLEKLREAVEVAGRQAMARAVQQEGA